MAARAKAKRARSERAKRAWETRRARAAGVVTVHQTGLTTGHFNRSDDTSANASIRERVLQRGLSLTTGPRNADYGDPLTNFELIAALKVHFWQAMVHSGKSVPQNSAFGHAIDMVLTKLARVATSPTSHLSFDCFVDAATYAAIAYEVGVRESEPAQSPA